MIIDSTWVLGFIILEKSKNSSENLVTYEEYYKILDILTKKYSLEIDESTNNYFFEFNGNAFELNKENDIKASDFINLKSLIKSGKLLKMINNLRRIISTEIKTLDSNIDYTSLESVIKRVVPDEKQFYTDVALTLSKSEYDYIKRNIQDKNCTNCTNRKCKKAFLEETSKSCVLWDNPEIVGKKKVLSKF